MKVLMVCLGNICRSPLAEGILKKKLQEAGLQRKHKVDSCGTSDYHLGEGPDHRSLVNAKANGIDISGHKARQINQDDFDKFDLIYCMDTRNLDNVLAMTESVEHRDKTDMILNVVDPFEDKDVPDPYFGGEGGFQEVFDLLDDACDKIVEVLEVGVLE